MALLDIALRNGTICPVADMLKERGIPSAFVTAYDRQQISARFAEVPYLAMPHDAAKLVALLGTLCGMAGKAA